MHWNFPAKLEQFLPGHQSLVLFLMEDYVFSVNSGHFSLSAGVSWSNWEQYLELFGFLEGAHNRELPIPHDFTFFV